MNYIKPLTASILACSALVSVGFVSDVFAEQNDDSMVNHEYHSHNYNHHKLDRNNFRNLRAGWHADGLPEVLQEKKTKAIAEIALNALYNDADSEMVDRYFAEDYIQHNPFGLNGISFVKDIFITNRPEGYRADTGFMMVDGEFALGHSRFTGFTGFYERPIIAVDVYRVKGGKVVEHWDVVQEEVYPDETVSGNAMFPVAPTYEYVSEPQEKLNAEMVRKAVTGLVEGDLSVLDEYYAEDYINHNPTASNGLDTLRGFSAENLPEGFEFEIGFVIADGPYVAMQTRAVGFGPVPVITFDIFRVSNNKIVEHWDVIQDEVPAENTTSGNPMFPIK